MTMTMTMFFFFFVCLFCLKMHIRNVQCVKTGLWNVREYDFVRVVLVHAKRFLNATETVKKKSHAGSVP